MYLDAASVLFEGGYGVTDYLMQPAYELWSSEERALAELMSCNSVAIGFWCAAATVMSMLGKLHDLCR